MASYTYTQLYGSGSIGENLSGLKTFTFTNPSGSSYFTMETIVTSTGFYEATSPKNFEGTYVHEVYGTVECSKKGKALELRFQNHPNLRAKLEYMEEDKFLCTYSDILYGIKTFPFVIEGDKVKSFTLSVADFLEHTTYDFTKQ